MKAILTAVIMASVAGGILYAQTESIDLGKPTTEKSPAMNSGDHSNPDTGATTKERRPMDRMNDGGMRTREGRMPGGEMDGPGGDGMLERILSNPAMIEELGLSEEKIVEIKDKLAEFKKKNEELRTQMQQAGKKQAELLTAKEVDEATLMAAVEETGKINTEIAKLRMQKLLLARQNISPEKMEKIREKIRERMGSMRDGEGKEGQGGDRMREKIREKMKQRRGGDDNEMPPPGHMPPPPPEGGEVM